MKYTLNRKIIHLLAWLSNQIQQRLISGLQLMMTHNVSDLVHTDTPHNNQPKRRVEIVIITVLLTKLTKRESRPMCLLATVASLVLNPHDFPCRAMPPTALGPRGSCTPMATTRLEGALHRMTSISVISPDRLVTNQTKDTISVISFQPWHGGWSVAGTARMPQYTLNSQNLGDQAHTWTPPFEPCLPTSARASLAGPGRAPARQSCAISQRRGRPPKATPPWATGHAAVVHRLRCCYRPWEACALCWS